MQITQFLVGASYAMLHSFVYYTVPVQVPVGEPVAAASSTPAAAATEAGFLDSIKQAVLGGADAATGAAAVVSPPAGVAAGTHQVQYQAVPCITTGGQTFAIWLNVLYLAPLTYLFVSFFIASYIKRTNADVKRNRVEKKVATSGETEVGRRLSNAMLNAEKAGWDAARSIEQEVYGQGNESAVVDDEEDLRPQAQNLAVPTSNGSARTLRSRTSGRKN
jgi:hypothetical protein